MDYLKINGQQFPTLLALTTEEQERGLMYREWPPPIMTFIYARPSYNQFWMKNTSSPLDVVFILNGKITTIHNGIPNSTTIMSGGISDMVIEFPRGTCEQHNIKVGDNIDMSFCDESKTKVLMAKSGFLF